MNLNESNIVIAGQNILGLETDTVSTRQIDGCSFVALNLGEDSPALKVLLSLWETNKAEGLPVTLGAGSLDFTGFSGFSSGGARYEDTSAVVELCMLSPEQNRLAHKVSAFLDDLEAGAVTLSLILERETPKEIYAGSCGYVASNGWKVVVFWDCGAWDNFESIQTAEGETVGCSEMMFWCPKTNDYIPTSEAAIKSFHFPPDQETP
jgi:hypothetical protein